MTYVEARKKLLEWLRKQLVGPATEEDSLSMSPLDRYPVGVLHPVVSDPSGTDPVSAGDQETNPAFLEDQEELVGEEDTTQAQPTARVAALRRFMPLSSVGFSFRWVSPQTD